jgi:hypothetical protein
MSTALLLHVSTSSSSDYVNVSMSFVEAEISEFDTVDKVRNFGCDNPRHDLCVTAQGDTADQDRPLYAWEVSYSTIYRATLSDLRPKVNELRRIERKLARLEESEGPAMLFWQYVVRVCRVTGAKVIKCVEQNGQNYDDNVYAVVPAQQLPYTIERAVSEATGCYPCIVAS